MSQASISIYKRQASKNSFQVNDALYYFKTQYEIIFRMFTSQIKKQNN